MSRYSDKPDCTKCAHEDVCDTDDRVQTHMVHDIKKCMTCDNFSFTCNLFKNKEPKITPSDVYKWFSDHMSEDGVIDILMMSKAFGIGECDRTCVIRICGSIDCCRRLSRLINRRRNYND